MENGDVDDNIMKTARKSLRFAWQYEANKD